jgi:hypothetical protein
MCPFASRDGQHPFRNVDTDDLRRSARGEVVRKLTGAAAEVEDARRPSTSRQHRRQIGVLERPRPPGSESLELRVPGEELRSS